MHLFSIRGFMRKTWLIITLLLLGLPSFANSLIPDNVPFFSSEFERVLQSNSKQVWTVTENQILRQWHNGGNIQKTPYLEIIGKPEKDYYRNKYFLCPLLFL